MSQIRITANAKDLEKMGFPILTEFKSKEGKRAESQPLILEKEGKVQWLVADTDYNREIFQRCYEPSGLFSADAVNQKPPEPFEKKPAKAETKKA